MLKAREERDHGRVALEGGGERDLSWLGVQLDVDVDLVAGRDGGGLRFSVLTPTR